MIGQRRRREVDGQPHVLIEAARRPQHPRPHAGIRVSHVAALREPADERVIGVLGLPYAIDYFRRVVYVLEAVDMRIVVVPTAPGHSAGIPGEGARDHQEPGLIGLALKEGRGAVVGTGLHHEDHGDGNRLGQAVRAVDIVVPALCDWGTGLVGSVERKVDPDGRCREGTGGTDDHSQRQRRSPHGDQFLTADYGCQFFTTAAPIGRIGATGQHSNKSRSAAKMFRSGSYYW